MSFVFLRQEIPEAIILRGYLGWCYKYVIRSYIHFLTYEMCLNCLINPQNKNGHLGISQRHSSTIMTKYRFPFIKANSFQKHEWNSALKIIPTV